MSAERNIDADAFIRKLLECPSDSTARLVFADWLEETGDAHNAAWAHFIRLKTEADHHPVDSGTRFELDRHAAQYAVHVRARLTIPAKLFINYPKSLLQLLPVSNIAVDLSRFAVQREARDLLPESVARENDLFPLDAQDNTLFIAAAGPADFDTLQKLEFILNRDILLIAAERDDIQRAIDREYGATEIEVVDSPPLEFVDTAIVFASTGPPTEPFDEYFPVVQLVNLNLIEAVNLRADGIRFVPGPDGIVVSYRINDVWTGRPDHAPLRLLHSIATRLAVMASIPIEWASLNPPLRTPITGRCSVQTRGVRLRVQVTVQPSLDGPTIHLDLVREPI